MKAFKKITNKISNSKIIKNPVFLVIGLIAIILVIALIYFIFLKYSPIMNFKYEGYAISGKDITENLLGSGETDNTNNNKNIELTKIEEQGTIFKKLNEYFVGSKEKKEINLNYPIYINDNSAIYNLAESSTLISKDFEEIAGYPNLSISEGKVYDGNNLERADAKEYIFVKTANEVYINLYEIKINTTANEYTIPVNSIMAFTENSIRYYTVNNNVLVFNQINDVDSNSNVQMVENNYTYEELLTNLRILQKQPTNNENNESQPNIIIENSTNSKAEENKQNEVEQDKTEETETEQEEPKNGYIKPEVTAEDFTPEVYTAKSVLTIKDPVERIVEAPTFEIYKDGKIYLRRTYTNSGNITVTGLVPETEYKIVGKYVYLNENGQKVENTFYEGTFTTKGYEELGSIDIQKENGEIYSNKIQLIKVKITSDLNAEVIKGISQVEIETGEIRTVLKNNQVNSLLRGEEITIESSEGLKSNSNINYAIKFYDKNGIELKVNNNEGETRTSKQAPTAKVSIKEQDIVSVTLRLNLTNKDNVELENYKYIVTRPNGEKVKEERLAENEKEILLEDLDQNQYYKISIYADYDLNNNKGKQENVELGNLVFATQPISTLGSLELVVENKELTSKTSTISYKIDEERTDKRLIQILNELTINIKDGENIVKTDTLTEDEITNLQRAGTKEIKYENLKSNTTYTIEITGNVQLGNTQEEIPVTYNYKEFITLKIPAKVEIRNQFVTGNLIDFDVRIEDINNSVLNNKVRMELRNSSNDLIDLQELTTNEDYIRKTYEKLEENQIYKLSFYADQYNEGSTDETYKVNYLIKEIEIVTEPGISGDIGLTELTRKAIGKNLVDMSSETKWYVYPNFNTSDYYGKEYSEETKILKLGGNGCARRAVYDLREYAGQEVTMSFKARRIDDVYMEAYIQNSKTDTNRTQIQGLTEEWQEFQYTLTVDSTGYLGFLVNWGSGIEIQELQIELGKRKTSYEEFKYTLQSNYSINLEDRRDEIITNDYYIKIYEDNNLIKTDRYEEIPEENKIENAIKTYETETNKQYKVELVVKLRDREYVLSELEYNTQDTEEIKGIYNKDDFLEIQPRGHYIVLNNLNLVEDGSSGKYRFSSNIPFEGVIDFNGKEIDNIIPNRTGYLFGNIGRTGIIENMVLNLHFPSVGRDLYITTGLFGLNYGTIKNIQVNIVETNKEVFTSMYGILGWSNHGTIEEFIINYEVPVYTYSSRTSLIQNSNGTIKNGYIFGKGIIYLEDLSGKNLTLTPFLYTNSSNGILENVYTLISSKNYNEMSVLESNLVINNNGVVRNCYSVDMNNTLDVTLGPNVMYNANTIDNVYYFSDKTISNTNEMKTSNLALYDSDFHEQVINSEGKFDIKDNVEKGYFPHLNMPSVMPNQEYIELPKIKDDDLIDVTSIEVLEKYNSSAKLKLVVNNKYGETITNVKTKNINCKILSQEYNEGKSNVIVEIYEPIMYTSEYEITSITSKGAYGQEYSREYNSGERKINIDLYKEINTIDDWKVINNSLSENYILNVDLDFMNEGDNIAINNGTFKGKLNGNNHTIKNINISRNKGGVFSNVSGTIENLKIENYKQEIANGNGGFISYLSTGAIVNNININNASINKIGEANITYGFITGYNFVATIKNSSVTNGTVIINNYMESIKLGGIVGEANSANVKNCFAQNLNIKVSNLLSNQGIGGIIGYQNNGVTTNCYSTGKIESNKEYVGGIVGYTTNKISNCYSITNIQTSAGYIGGIVGYMSFTPGDQNSDNPIKYNLYLGNLYTSSNTSNRIVGNGDMGIGNVGYIDQSIIGAETDESIIRLLDYEDLFKEDTYTKTLLWEDNNYDFSKLKDSCLPLLKSSDTGKVLYNQDDITLQRNTLSINKIETNKINEKLAEIRLEIKTRYELKIKSIYIDNMNVEIEKNVYQNGITYLNIKATPIKFLDNYKISKIIYIKNDKEEELEVQRRIDIRFYKEIFSIMDWQSLDEISAENIKLMSDLDFNSKNDAKYNVSIGRLEGNNHTIKNININMNSSGGLIKEIKEEANNINFDNIIINNTNTGQYSGIIASNSGILNNINFSNIEIHAQNMSYIGCIANNTGTTIKSINLNNITIEGKSYIGGAIAYTLEHDITDISGENININATGDFIGGIIGRADWSDYGVPSIIKNNIINNSNIKGRNNVGGFIGYGRLYYIEGNNNDVEGDSYVGGLSGHAYTLTYYSVVRESTIKGNVSNIAGIAGCHDGVYACHVYDSTIQGIGSNTNEVGGLVATIAGSATIEQSSVENCIIESTGSYVGGINSSGIGSINSFVYNTKISGYSNVGGVNGKLTPANGFIYNVYINADISGVTNTVGGFTGYLNNQEDTGNIDRTTEIYNSAILNTTIKAEANVGGIAGKTDKELYSEEFYKGLYVEAYIEGNESSTSIGIGSNKSYNSKLKNFSVYKYSKINSQNINENMEPFVNIEDYLSGDDLKEKETYTKKIGWSENDWKFDVLAENKYPILNSTELKQQGIELPTDDEKVDYIQTQENTEERPEQTSEYNNKTIQTYSTYSLITAEDGSKVTRNAKLYVKDNTLYAIPSVVSANKESEVIPVANNLIIDSYNGKEYETVLGSDGKVYDLKEPITYPEKFVNLDIESVGNNLNSDVKEVEVTYKNGDKIKFNYQTGEVISSTEADQEKTGLFDYLKEKISEIGDASANAVSQEITNKYEASKELQTKLEETSVEEAMGKQNINKSNEGTEGVTATENNESNNSLKENKYISVYDKEIDDYLIYNEEELLDTSKEEVVSENEKIEANNLNKYYASEGETKNTKMGIVWIAISIIGVGIILFALRKNLKKKKA